MRQFKRPERSVTNIWYNPWCRGLLFTVTLALTAGCSSESNTGPDLRPPQINGNAVAGLEAFQLNCASCHSSGDGVDLKFFAYPDTTIVRRAVAHVDTTTAHDIVAYIRTVPSAKMQRNLRIFQPGGKRIGGDGVFAANIFGRDLFPPDMTTERMAGIDPLKTRIALNFPLWSLEFGNMDWMPEAPINKAILDYPTEYGTAREHIEWYHDTHSVEALLWAVLALRVSEREPENPDAPCVMEPFDRFRPTECFETRRWIATLATQHMLRTGDRTAIHQLLHDGWWDVGNAARASRHTDRPIDNATENWAQWMYLGWAFEPANHSSIYLGLALNALDLPRHATFHAARSMVERSQSSREPFDDLYHIAQFSPSHWTYNAVRFGYEHLVERLAERGPHMRNQHDVDEAKEVVLWVFNYAAHDLPESAKRDQLAELRDQILAGLDQLPIRD